MAKLRVLHLEDNPNDAFLVRRMLERSGIDAEITVASSAAEYLSKIQHREVDLILCDNGFLNFTGKSALEAARKYCPNVPFVFVSGNSDEAQIIDRLNSGAADYVTKNNLWQLITAIRRIRKVALEESPNHLRKDKDSPAHKLTLALQEIASAHTTESLMPTICRGARAITGADGSALIFREGEECYCACEDSIAPLWKGKRFPISICPRNWGNSEGEGFVVEDIRSDSRVGADLYRSTFVKSIALVPFNPRKSSGMIGCFWARHYHATTEQMEFLKALAAGANSALESTRARTELKRQLATANHDLEILRKAGPYRAGNDPDPAHMANRH